MKNTNRLTAIIMAFLMVTMISFANTDGVFAARVKSKPSVKITTLTSKNNYINKEQALSILKKKEKNKTFIYMGTEKDFEYLSESKQKGYVFLPDEEGDIGYFVNRINKKVYYFHPSGYMELMK